MTGEPSTLTAWRTLLERTLADQRAEIDEARTTDGVYYGPAGPLTVVRDRAYFPGNLYFDGGQPVMVYVERPSDHAPDLTDEALLSYLGDDVEWLRSRAGKLARIRLAADRGIAVSETGGTIDFLELFPPTTPADYKSRLYAEPPEFVR